MRVKTPTIIQMEAIECGAVSLAIILAYNGCYVSIDELRDRCGVSRDGAKATDLLAAAEYYQMETAAYVLSGEDTEDHAKLIENLKDIPLPFIAFWEFNHFLVVEGYDKKKVYLNDPATGPRSVTHEEFSRSFTGAILTVTPTPKFQKRGKQSSLIQVLWEKLKGSRSDLVFLVAISLLLSVPGLITPIFSKVFIDDILLGKNYLLLRSLLFFMVGTALASTLMLWIQKRCLMRFYVKLFATSTANFFWHILHIPAAFFNNYYTGDIIQRVKANGEIAALLSGETSATIVSIITIVVYAIALLFLAPVYLALIIFAAAVINIVVFKFIGRKLADGNRRLQQEAACLSGVAFNGLQLMETIKSQGMENVFFARWAGLLTRTINTMQSFSLSAQVLMLTPVLISGITSLLILALATISIMHGDMTIGSYLAFTALMINFLSPLSTLTSSAQSFKSAEANVERINDVLRYNVDPRFVPTDAITQKNQLTGRIEVQGVTFGYNRMANPLIKEFNLTVTPGARIALVGSTGSGKSTISRLISGYYWPWSGKVLFDDQEIQNLPPEIIRQSIGIVSQEIFLFEGTIRDNISLWDETIDDHQILEALRDACIDDIIETRGGILAETKEGGLNFSVGQQQRLEIARALVRNPSILLLDEAYSALDTKTELAIDRNIRRRGCTCLIVAHRLSTIRDCDEIVVLNKGVIEERGQHNELFARNGFYTKLVKGLT